jgi:hypothetical protein
MIIKELTPEQIEGIRLHDEQRKELCEKVLEKYRDENGNIVRTKKKKK